MEYEIKIRKAKGVSKCRVCYKNIHPRELTVFIEVIPYFGNEQKLICHTDCFLKYMIRNIRKIQLEDMKQELDKFKKIDELLSKSKKKPKEAKKK